MKLSPNQYEGWRLLSKVEGEKYIHFHFGITVKNILIRQKKKNRSDKPIPRIIKPIKVKIKVRYSIASKMFTFWGILVEGHPKHTQWHRHMWFSHKWTGVCWGGEGETWRVKRNRSLFKVLNTHLMVLIGVLANYSDGLYEVQEHYKQIWTVPVKGSEMLETFPKEASSSDLGPDSVLPDSFWGREG